LHLSFDVLNILQLSSLPHFSGRPQKNWERWSGFLQTKQKLRIGGIFPMRGNKFRAPELLPGEFSRSQRKVLPEKKTIMNFPYPGELDG